MPFVINIQVKKNGRLKCETEDPIDISVYKESNRVKLAFMVDSEIDDQYHYLKFTHANTSYLYRVHNNEFLIPKAITAWEGRWEISFVCCDEPANSDGTITADYIYASVPLVCDVHKGNLGYTAQTEEQVILKKICEGTFDHFDVPQDVEYLSSYLFSNIAQEFTFFVSANVETIEEYVLYQSGCTSITFEEGSRLTALADHALYRIANLGNIKFPANLSSWGKYNLGGCGCQRIEFETNSKLKSLTSYALWNINGVKTIYLPDRLESFTGGTSVIKSCPLVEEVRFPNTLNTVIPANAINDCENLTRIILQSNFNVSANFSNCSALTHDTIVAMFQALKDLTGGASKTLTIGEVNLAKVSTEEIQIALNKNWSIS